MDGVTLHPHPGRIPEYHSDKHTLIPDSQPASNSGYNSSRIESLIEMFSNFHNLELKKIDVSLSEVVKFVSITSERIVIVDSNNSSVVEYSLTSGTTNVIASKGRGPGDVLLPVDAQIRGMELIITMKDMRVSRFNCWNSPCTYESSVQLPITPVSAAISDSSIAILGNIPVTSRDPELIDLVTSRNSVNIFDLNGNELGRFGKAYDTDKEWMLIPPMTEGVLAFHESSEWYYLAYKRIPLIYVYSKLGDLVKTYKIESFDIGLQEYEKTTGRLGGIYTDYQFVENLTIVDDIVYIVVVKLYDRQVTDTGVVRKSKSTLYAIDIQSNSTFQIGDIDGHIIHPTRNGFVFTGNGSTYYFDNDK